MFLLGIFVMKLKFISIARKSGVPLMTIVDQTIKRSVLLFSKCRFIEI